MADQNLTYTQAFTSTIRRVLTVEGFIRRMDNTAVNNAPLYIGLAKPGTAASAAGWQITKLTYDGNGAPDSVLFAGGSTDFNQIWDDRATLSYS